MKHRRSPADRHAERAFTHLEARRLGEARAEIDRALALDPDHLSATTALARVEVAEGHADRGIARLRQRHARDPRSEETTFALSRLLVDTGAIGAAVELLEGAVKANPGAIWPLEDLASTLHGSAKDPARSLDAIAQALGGDRPPSRHDALALFHTLDEIVREALDAGDDAIAERGLATLAPHTPSGPSLLECLRAIRRKALPDALLALDARPNGDYDNAAIVVRLGARIARAYEANGSTTALELAFSVCYQLRYDDHDSVLSDRAGRLRRRLHQQDFDIACEASRTKAMFYRRRLRGSPDDAQAWAGLARAYQAMLHQDAAALDASRRAFALAPEDRDIAEMLHRQLERAKLPEEAAEVGARLEQIRKRAIAAFDDVVYDVPDSKAEEDESGEDEDAEADALEAPAADTTEDPAGDAADAPATPDPAEEEPSGDPPEGGPNVPSGLVLRPRFETAFGAFEAGKAFVVRLAPGAAPLVVTAQHLFGPAGGAPRVIDAADMAGSVSGADLTDAFDGAPICRAGPALAVPYACDREERADIAAFPLADPGRAAPARLAKEAPRYDTTVWLASPMRGGAPADQRLYRGTVNDADDDLFCFLFDDQEIDLAGTSGAPILDAWGRVVGVHVRFEKTYKGLVGHAIAAPALRGFLSDALDPERLKGETMVRRQLSMSLHVKTLATLTAHQAGSLIVAMDPDTGEQCQFIDCGPLKITLDYPLNKPHEVSIAGGKSTAVGDILWQIAKAYEEVYRDPEKYGIWGHDLSDLYLERLTIDGDRAQISVGS